MANIKVSELPTATSFEDDDYVMIVQSNTNKKITKENMYGNYNYSSNEIVIGKWIDGKPLYRKVYTISRGASTGTHWTDFADMPTNLETVVSMHGVCTEFPSGNAKPTPHWEEADGSAYYELYIARFDTHKLAYQSAYRDGISYVILEYTKTTD